MSKKRGLGKGLGALIGITNDDSESVLEQDERIEIDDEIKKNKQAVYQDIAIEKLIPNSSQPRIDFNIERLEELVQSIKEHGIVQPIVVRLTDQGVYEIIAGERRWRACKILGLNKIPAIIKNYNEIDMTVVSLIENIQREDLNSIEEANAYKKLMETFSLTQEDISLLISKSRSHIANILRLLSLPEEIKLLVTNRSITTGHAKALLALPDEETQKLVVEKIIANNLSVREVEKLIKDIISDNIKKQKEKPEKEKAYILMENNLNSYLKTMVNIRVNNQGSGKIEILYKNKNELDRIINLIGNIK
ncbi:parB-like partition protein [Desulfofarcimen acetoxidans DSM 771]|uniref:ParB-like partition protein n=1 Tax=Desulfofarcimen acetoxidans (strain ATCC 49208 / DSM 771 / KCTC 5769 / VKM B-1644 / 5575) TaxID=485916 RepID=C8W056_DESAS|nr:ParB/RepB/Spo0J family partition protein [Desulfofarcimen acetoxidans]ACV65024.1 parB-like partition protein [Desulfofarcimen acetoxidans DSM 771]